MLYCTPAPVRMSARVWHRLRQHVELCTISVRRVNSEDIIISRLVFFILTSSDLFKMSLIHWCCAVIVSMWTDHHHHVRLIEVVRRNHTK